MTLLVHPILNYVFLFLFFLDVLLGVWSTFGCICDREGKRHGLDFFLGVRFLCLFLVNVLSWYKLLLSPYPLLYAVTPASGDFGEDPVGAGGSAQVSTTPAPPPPDSNSAGGGPPATPNTDAGGGGVPGSGGAYDPRPWGFWETCAVVVVFCHSLVSTLVGAFFFFVLSDSQKGESVRDDLLIRKLVLDVRLFREEGERETRYQLQEVKNRPNIP